MGYPRALSEPRGWAFALCVLLLEPVVRLVTLQRWIDGEKIPSTGGCVLVANHLSHADPFTFTHFVYGHGRKVRWLAKAEVFAIPVLGRLVAAAGQIPVHRLTSNAALAYGAAVDAVREGGCVVIYPEGTITRQPDLWPMSGRTGAARIALAAGVPLVPVAQWGPERLLAPYARRPHLWPPTTIVVKAGDPVDLDDLRGRELTPEVLHQATERIMDAVTALLEDIRGERAPRVRYDARAEGVAETGNPMRRPRRQPDPNGDPA